MLESPWSTTTVSASLRPSPASRSRCPCPSPDASRRRARCAPCRRTSPRSAWRRGAPGRHSAAWRSAERPGGRSGPLNGVHGVLGLMSPRVHSRISRRLCRLPERDRRSLATLEPERSSSTDQPRCRRSALSERKAATGAPMAPRMVAARISLAAGNEQMISPSGEVYLTLRDRSAR